MWIEEREGLWTRLDGYQVMSFPSTIGEAWTARTPDGYGIRSDGMKTRGACAVWPSFRHAQDAVDRAFPDHVRRYRREERTEAA